MGRIPFIALMNIAFTFAQNVFHGELVSKKDGIGIANVDMSCSSKMEKFSKQPLLIRRLIFHECP